MQLTICDRLNEYLLQFNEKEIKIDILREILVENRIKLQQVKVEFFNKHNNNTTLILDIYYNVIEASARFNSTKLDADSDYQEIFNNFNNFNNFSEYYKGLLVSKIEYK